ncbi:hypothetical protein F5X99DRAFT_417869 [Biscogniauxia marginata]|nr:hypothetical protein F5X99DRAFT_417869 [Biscogniauxia marginata]
MTRKARFSCAACRRLKRRCPKELPSCTLCARLKKKCEYPPRALGSYQRLADSIVVLDSENGHVDPDNQSSCRSSSGALDGLRQSPASETPRACDFPVMYFLDSGTCLKPLSPTQPLCPVATSASPTPEVQALVEEYFSAVHPWLPILSKKRIRQTFVESGASEDALHALLLLCMKLLSEPLPPETPAAATYGYLTAKESLLRVESSYFPSLALLQSVILIAVYEISHGIYPAAYLRVGHASRLAIMMGFHDRKHASQMFKETSTWTGREEERRAWWMVFCLERYVNQGIEVLTLCTPEPSPGELLPSHEASWDDGAVGFNEPLFASSFSASTSLGAFANMCQAALVLGRVLRHRDEATANLALTFRMSEARQLHFILVSLSTHLSSLSESLPHGAGAGATTVSLALCSSARLILYNMYACNERYSSDHERCSEEADMQKLTLGGIVEVTRATGRFARHVLDSMEATTGDAEDGGDDDAVQNHHYGDGGDGGILSPLVAHSLYEAATECEWFILEQQDSDAVVWLRDIVKLLRVMARRWQVAGVYLSQIYKWPGYKNVLS